ncbi:MAG: TIGR03746 family integrating conjugative element protein [Legionellales bacterium]|nr:TIGR03746 family integrating conjugative element protein [Legionellales bacterium]
MKFLNALEQAKKHVRTLWSVIILLFLVNALALLGWMHSQSKIKIEVPRQIPVSGLTITQGEVPPTTVYSFAFYVWQSINHWSQNGMQNYKAQITQFSPFLTPSFKLKLIQNYNYLLNEGELQDRLRLMQGISGSEYSPHDVKYMGHGTWIVHLKMHLTEMMNTNAKIVKDVQMNYTLKIVRYDVDAEQNPWGLAIAGFEESPERIKTII